MQSKNREISETPRNLEKDKLDLKFMCVTILSPKALEKKNAKEKTKVTTARSIEAPSSLELDTGISIPAYNTERSDRDER